MRSKIFLVRVYCGTIEINPEDIIKMLAAILIGTINVKVCGVRQERIATA